MVKMFQQSLFVLFFAFVNVGWALQCYQCNQFDIVTLATDESCRHPFNKTSTPRTHECNANQVCVKYTTPPIKFGDSAPHPLTARYCGTANACEGADAGLQQKVQSSLGELLQNGDIHQLQQLQHNLQQQQNPFQRPGNQQMQQNMQQIQQNMQQLQHNLQQQDFQQVQLQMQQRIQVLKQIQQSIIGQKGQCSVCSSNLCNSASTMLPSYIISALFIAKYFL